MTAPYPSGHKEWLAKLISFDTTSRNSNLELIHYVRDYFQSLGVTSLLVYNDAKTHANLFATLPGADGMTQGGIVLSGHTDVVPVDGQKWDTDPFKMVEQDGKLYGRGTCDMKGFIAVALSLAPIFLRMQRVKPVHYALSFDEEVGCTGVPLLTNYLKEKGFKADCCLVGDGALIGKVVTGSKGFASWKVTVYGKSIHSSMALMNTSCNAIEYAAQIIAKIREIALELKQSGPRDANYTCPFAAMSTGLVKGGIAVNTVPESCEFTFSVRITDVKTAEYVQSSVSKFIEQTILPAMRQEFPAARVDMTPDWKLLPFNAKEDNAFTLLARQVTGDKTINKMGGGTEAGYFEDMGIPTIIAGGGGFNGHLANEHTTVAFLEKCRAITHELVYRSTAQSAFVTSDCKL